MDDVKNEKLKRFANDVVMNSAVKELVEMAILDRKGAKDVYILAAERITLDILSECWKKLEIYKIDNEKKEKQTGNIGL